MDFDIILFVLIVYNSKVYNPPQIEVAYTNKTQFTLCGLIFHRNLFLTFDTGTVPWGFLQLSRNTPTHLKMCMFIIAHAKFITS